MSTNCQNLSFVQIRGSFYTYNKQKIIGEGSGGVIYKGKDQRNNTSVAIKILKDQNFIQNQITFKEMIQLTTFKPNNIKFQFFRKKKLLQILDVIQLDKTYFIMQLCDYNLIQYIKSLKQQIKQQKILSILQKVTQALLQIQKQGYHFTDLKPENIILGDIQSLINVKNKKSSYHEQIFGTLHYMAPEVINLGQYSSKNYIWTLGVMIHQMIYHTTPFKEDLLQNNLLNKDVFYKNLFGLQIQKAKYDEYKICHVLMDKMLHFNSQKRISLQQLKQFLNNSQNIVLENQVLKSLNLKRERSNSLMTNDSDQLILQLKQNQLYDLIFKRNFEKYLSFRQNQKQNINSNEKIIPQKNNLFQELNNLINQFIFPLFAFIKIPHNFIHSFKQLKRQFQNIFISFSLFDNNNQFFQQRITQLLKISSDKIKQSRALSYLKKTTKYINCQQDKILNANQLKLLKYIIQYLNKIQNILRGY